MASAIVRTLRDGRLEGGPSPLVVVESNGCHAEEGQAVLRLLLRATADAAHAERAQGSHVVLAVTEGDSAVAESWDGVMDSVCVARRKDSSSMDAVPRIQGSRDEEREGAGREEGRVNGTGDEDQGGMSHMEGANSPAGWSQGPLLCCKTVAVRGACNLPNNSWCECGWISLRSNEIHQATAARHHHSTTHHRQSHHHHNRSHDHEHGSRPVPDSTSHLNAPISSLTSLKGTLLSALPDKSRAKAGTAVTTSTEAGAAATQGGGIVYLVFDCVDAFFRCHSPSSFFSLLDSLSWHASVSAILLLFNADLVPPSVPPSLRYLATATASLHPLPSSSFLPSLSLSLSVQIKRPNGKLHIASDIISIQADGLLDITPAQSASHPATSGVLAARQAGRDGVQHGASPLAPAMGGARQPTGPPAMTPATTTASTAVTAINAASSSPAVQAAAEKNASHSDLHSIFAPMLDTPFRLQLSDKEREARRQVQLPYEHKGERGAIHIYDGRQDSDGHLFGGVTDEADALYCDDSDEEDEEIEGGIPDDIDDDLDL